MAPCALSLLAFTILAQLTSALRHAAVATKEDPTSKGQMTKFSQHQPWIAELFADRDLAERELEARYPTVLAAIRKGLESPGDGLANYESACEAVYGIAVQEHKTKPYVAAAGGIEVTVKALKAYLSLPEEDKWPEKSVTGARLCAAAVSMVSMYQRDVMEEAGKAGAVELVLQLQRRFWYDASMQIGGLSGAFMDFSATNRKRWADAGGIEYTLKAIKTHYGNPEVVLQSWYAFSSGTQTPNERAFVENGGIEAAMRSMVDHANYSRVREEAIQAMRAVGRCEGCGDLQARLVEAGFLENLAGAMKEVPDDIHIQSPCCANAEILTRSNATIREHAVKAGLPDLALKAIRGFPTMVSSVKWGFDDQYTVYEDCMGALANLAEVPRVKSKMKEGHVAQDIQAALDARPNSTRLRKSASRVLAALGESIAA